jgi:hypothetical protein
MANYSYNTLEYILAAMLSVPRATRGRYESCDNATSGYHHRNCSVNQRL